MKIALLQTVGRDGVGATLDHLAEAAAEAGRQGARLLVAPEMVLTGYNIGERVWALAEPAGGPSARRAAEIAAETGVALLYGFPERSGEAVYNAVQFVGPDGRRSLYRKAHLFGPEEKRLYRPGAMRPPVLEIEGLKVGLLICYDVEFPEAVRALAREGVQLVAVPTALMMPFPLVAETVVAARAYENGVYVAYVNRVGSEGDLTYVGRSCLIGPDGAEVARAGGTDEALLLAEIDPAAIARARGFNPYLSDLRRDLYL